MDMMDTTLGTHTEEPDGTVTLRYERRYPRPIATVWSAISAPERIADWLGVAELEPRVGGRFTVMVGPNGDIGIEGEVLAWEPPSVLAVSWAWPGGKPGVVRYDLAPDGPQATRLVFTHRGVRRDQTLSVLPGWHLYLTRLEQVVEGEKPERDFSALHADIRALYSQRHGAQIGACQPQ